MNNFKIKILGLFLLNALSLVISDQLEVDRVSEERNKIFSDHGCREGECEIIKIGIPRRHKRSVDSTIDLPIKAFGHEINLKLIQSKGILVGPKTPIYLAHSATNIEKILGYFSSNMRSQLYEDEEHLAAFTIDEFENGSPQVKYGYIGSKNIIIDRTHPNSNSSEDENPYLAKCSLEEIYYGISWLLNQVFPKPPPKEPGGSLIPHIIYPEILVIFDYSIYQHINGQNILHYILQFWNGVDLFYRQIKNPQYKLSIAGVVIAQNENVFRFLKPSLAPISSERLICYEDALLNMTLWLQNAKSSIPFNSYDTHFIMVPYRDGSGLRTATVGLSRTAGACYSALFESPEGGIIYDPYDFTGVLTGAHELGHILGAGHDDDSCGLNTIMRAIKRGSPKTWSQCSIDDFHENLQTNDFSCMYNKPDLENSKFQNSYLPIDNQPVYYNDNNNLQPEVFHVEIKNDGDKLEVSFHEFSPYRRIEVFYRKHKLIITQRNTGKETINLSANRKNLKVCVLDDLKVTLHPSEINPSEIINIYHEENKIYIYQGDKPECHGDAALRTSDVPKNNKDNRPDLELSIEDGNIIYVQKTDFNVNKLVGIYYRDNQLFVSQRGSPINYNFHDETIAADLQYVGSDKTKIFLDPKKIDPKKEICIQHSDNSIYIYQDRKPDLSLRENKPDDIKYLPEDFSANIRERKPRAEYSNVVSTPDINSNYNKILVSEISKRLPKPDEGKSKSVLDITFASGETLNIGPSEFDKKNLLFILFENNLMKVTQMGAPREPYSYGKNVYELSTITSDEYKLVVHPTAFYSRVELKIRHENGKIYFWIGTDELPNVNIDQPDAVEAVERDSVIWELQKNMYLIPEIFESGKVHVLYPRVFSSFSLVSIALDNNHKLEITQKGTPLEDRSYIPSMEYKNFKIMTSDRNKLLLHPLKVDSYRYLHIKHDNDNGLIYVSSGNPEYSFVNTNVSGIIEVIEPDPKVNAAPGPIDKIPESGDRPSAPKSMGPEPGHRQPVYNNGSVVPESKGSEPGYKQPVHNNGSPIPESMQLVKPKPDHKQISNRLPKPDEGKSKSVVDVTFNSGETLNIFPFEFDNEKQFFILFENNMMKVTQIGTPGEFFLSGQNIHKLSIITSDENTLVVHPATFFSRAELKIRHENGKIYFWIGTDELPEVNTDQPDCVEAVERDSVIWDLKDTRTIDDTFESGKVYVFLPRIFNEIHLVSIALDNNNNLKITQKGTPLEDRLDETTEYKNFRIKTSDRNTLLLHPKKVHPYRYLHIKHDNGLIYVSCGTPEYPFVNTNVFGIIEIIEPGLKVHDAPSPVDKTPQSRDMPSAPKYMRPEPDHKQPVYNNGSPIPESEQSVPESKASEPGYKQPVHNNEPPKPESKQPVPESKGSEPGYKQPVHNNGSPIPDSMQPVPEDKGSEPDHTTSNPYDVKLKPDHKPSEPDDLTIPNISKSFDDSLPVVLTSDMFNLNKLVVISHKKHKINVYQTDRDDDYDEDDDENNSGYTDLHYSIPKRGTVTFDPRKLNPSKMIIINYMKKKIHVNTVEL